MPQVEIPVEKWAGKVREVTIGGDGGRKAVTVGGESALPFLHFEGAIPNRPVIAVDVQDCEPTEWPANLVQAWGDVVKDPAAWAQKAVEFGADIIALRLRSAHPDVKNSSAAEVAETVKKVLAAVDVPLLIYGPGVAEKDNEVLVAAADAAAGQKVALGICEEKNYRTIVAACMANGHIAIARTPIEINLAKQLNILITDMGLTPDRILMDPTTGALGYGIEYSYSVMERLRLAALQGDSMTQQPMICSVGEEAWRQKETRASDGVPEAWGEMNKRAGIWESMTATTLLQAGADVLVMRSPAAIKLVKSTIGKLMG